MRLLLYHAPAFVPCGMHACRQTSICNLARSMRRSETTRQPTAIFMKHLRPCQPWMTAGQSWRSSTCCWPRSWPRKRQMKSPTSLHQRAASNMQVGACLLICAIYALTNALINNGMCFMQKRSVCVADGPCSEHGIYTYAPMPTTWVHNPIQDCCKATSDCRPCGQSFQSDRLSGLYHMEPGTSLIAVLIHWSGPSATIKQFCLWRRQSCRPYIPLDLV